MNYKQLNNLCEQGLAVEFQDVDGLYIIIGGGGKDLSGYWKDSHWKDSIEECLEEIGQDEGYTQGQLVNKLPSWTHTNTYKKINGEWKPLGKTGFEENKNAEELGIDIKKALAGKIKFRVGKVMGDSDCFDGDILELRKDDGSDDPYFWNLTDDRGGSKHETEDKWMCCAKWSQLEYVDEFKHVILCSTRQDWIDICQWLEDNTDKKWLSGCEPTENNYWDDRKEKSMIIADDDIMWDSVGCAREDCPDHKFITAKEFLAEYAGKEEEKKPRFITCDMGNGDEETAYAFFEINNYKSNKHQKTIMSKAIKFLEGKALKIKDSKVFETYKAGLTDKCGNLTEEGEAVKSRLLQGLVWEEMVATAKEINKEEKK